ncbi:MAG: hypothetical protein A3B99_01525 [Candidatus Yanofskybacteria bacterium RIFCSPHIGHO2_02_FULL_44_12b]|uniref:Major facilitator superfamily (MFS) profile domain-containing protein n=2 Tax=Candidatus Yanofskyibacteriota TaxID=1752733 RepID=A0A1F8GIY1_9BACT|nr:MAG: hypothetical protein UW79_C0030G0012 [Candidatus Yanofskybacteria bacterium GW2011_GWA2_44_9]OGN05609.1 MAG: hypothetical protein A2659_04865 [Candidatus Yanofskybacteria bacterium RIFCSPHIGHO2_01_FULL_44_24]OGN14013.1 MAG: hypothetical protein A3B99_01525 [Candidatus Yanofskybacteria bacterium RIFCSPHIGHO2_02_FULL_44_12b]OGN25283.1 MAG: hypothetical protein A2925_01645 [Candidatus Yanofskybacteria bacterium RIFCSPLOWO2_01_FULL_44_22]
MRINHVVKTLVWSDFYLESGLAFFAPIFAVFVTGQINGGSLQVVGFAAALTQICKIILEIPIAKYLDKNHGEYDDFYSMVFGSFLMSMAPFMYLFASTVNHIYIISAVYGIGLAFFVPPRFAIFSRHIDKEKENIEWTFKSIAVGIGAAGAAALGGVIAEKFGFSLVFVIAGVVAIMASTYEIKIFKDLKEKVPQGTVRPADGKLP